MDWVNTAVASLPEAWAAKIQDILALLAERLADFSSYPFLVPISGRLYWIYLISFLVIALVIYAIGKRTSERFSVKDFFKFWLPGSVYRHPSTVLDLKYYIVNRILVKVTFVSALVGSFYVFADGFEAILRAIGVAPVPEIEATLPIRAAYVAAVILAADFGFFFGHYLSHKVPVFWEFHKVHHSAEVLNPLTNYRFHPFDMILLGLCIGISTGVVKGAFGLVFGGGLHEIAAVSLTVIVLFNLTANLRHSHVWLSYGWHLNHIFSSPAQHQIHHGTAARHIDKNFGLMLSIWDWLAGTLYVPRGREDLKLGLSGGESKEYNSLWRLYTLPLVKAESMLFGRGDNRSADPQRHGEP